jgi:hypothetical protein
LDAAQSTTMLYRAPGSQQIHGHAVDYTIVTDDKIDEHLAAGWFLTAIEAGEAHLKALAEKAEQEAEELESKAIATRDEVVQKLEELGVAFDRRWGLTRLTKLVEDTLAGKTAADPTAGGTAPQG